MGPYLSKVLVGTISCISKNTNFKESRIKMHRKQLDWLEDCMYKMKSEHDEDYLPYYRVEQGWEPETEEALKTTLRLHSLKFPTPIPPGAARNELLKVLYNSDADWLVCMDDDHALYNHYEDYQLMWDIASPLFLEKFCTEGIIITAFPAYWDGYKKKVSEFGHAKEAWLFKNTKHPGAMPLCCIPNIKKYWGKEIFFDNEAMNNSVDNIPEDLKFQFDWIKAGGKVVECMMFIGKSLGNLEDSTLFDDHSDRMEIYKANDQWAINYLKSLYPRRPDLWGTKKFLKRKNPPMHIVMPRKYSITEE